MIKQYVYYWMTLSLDIVSCGRGGKMVNIDCNYYINVAKLMKKEELQRPRRRFLTGDGEFLPVVTVEVEI